MGFSGARPSQMSHDPQPERCGKRRAEAGKNLVVVGNWRSRCSVGWRTHLKPVLGRHWNATAGLLNESALQGILPEHAQPLRWLRRRYRAAGRS